MIVEFDDFGCSHEISAMCQSHDCRDILLRLKEINPDFKTTLFAIPGEMTQELLNWCENNKNWIELAVHGFYHDSNWECEKMSYGDFDVQMSLFSDIIEVYFVKVFRAPGWQISDDIFRWLKDHDWIVADQSYNNDRRPTELRAYVNNNGEFYVAGGNKGAVDNRPVEVVDGYHGHTWNVGALGGEPNGIYEDYDKVERLVREAKTFQFVSELFG